MKFTQFARLFAIAALATGALAAGRGSAATIFSDNFESGMGNWTQTSATVGTGLVAGATPGSFPLGGTTSALGDSSADRMHRNIIADNGGVELSGYSKFTSWIYDDGNNGSTGATRIYNEVRSYTSGTGLPNGGTVASGTLGQLIAIGKMNQPTGFGGAFSATRYQGRIISGPAGQTGYFNLSDGLAPVRSVGWHRFDIERSIDGTTLKFYVDNVLSKTLTGYTAANLPSWDTIVIGPGTGTTLGNYAIDGVSLENIPEPATLALAGMGLLGMASFARRKNA